MSLSHTSLFLALGLSVVNTAMTSESLEGELTATYLQKEQPLLIAAKKDKRQRGGYGCGTPPNVWAVDICQDSIYTRPSPLCYTYPKEVNLWLVNEKRSGRKVDRVVIKNTRTQQEVFIRWLASEVTLVWPRGKMPIQSGTTYLIRLKKSRGHYHRKIIFFQIPAHLSIDAQVSEMRKKGCMDQANLLEGQRV